MTKPLHAGWAARNGVTAALLASKGFTADARALEGESGWLRAASGAAEFDASAAVRALGEPWEIVSPGIGVKLYPCCYATHRAIDAALEIRAAHGIEAGDITRIEAVVSPGTLVPLIDRAPETGLEGKFSLEYCLAAALLDGLVSLAGFTDDAVRRAEAQRLASLVQISEGGPQLDFPIEGVAAVTVETRDEKRISARVETPKGDPRRPLTWDELAAKFRDCASLVLPPERAEKAIEMITGIESLQNVRELVAMLGPA